MFVSLKIFLCPYVLFSFYVNVFLQILLHLTVFLEFCSHLVSAMFPSYFSLPKIRQKVQTKVFYVFCLGHLYRWIEWAVVQVTVLHVFLCQKILVI